MNQSSHRHASSFLKKSCLSVLASVAFCGGYALAQAPQASVQYAVPAGDLIQVVNEISRNSGVQIVYDIELLRGKRAAAVSGEMTLAQALDRALADSGLHWTRVSPTTISIGRKAPPARPKKDESDAPASTERKADERREVKELEDVVVVGSRLGSSPVESAMPIKVITRDEIDRSGAGSISQMLSYLPEVPINNGEDRQITGLAGAPEGGNTNSSTVQMRGLPRGTTLVLINGRRSGDSGAFSNNGFFDLSSIPLALVERIEVLPAGASAVYGGDALAGVINIVLRKDASGFEIRARTQAANGYGASQASVVWGNAWSRGGLTAVATWSKNSALYNNERALTSDADFRRFGGYDLRSASSYPATVYSLDGCPESAFYCTVPLDQRGSLPGLDSPVAVVPWDSNGLDLTPDDFRATQGAVNKTTLRRHIRSPEEKYGFNFSGHFEISSAVEVFSELTYTKRDVPAWQALFPLYGGEGGVARALIPADHPFNPFGVAVGVDFLYKDTGIFTSSSHEHKRGLLGLRGKISNFDWEVSGFQARDTTSIAGSSSFDVNKVAIALASKDPEETINPFVSDGGAPASIDVLKSLMSSSKADMSARVSGLSGHIRGRLFEAPAGAVVALMGAERLVNRVNVLTDDIGNASINADGESTNQALFGEFRLPLLSPRKGQSLERAAITGALRRETSDRYSGSALTETFGLEFRPWDSLLLRSTYSTGFRPITMFSASLEPAQGRSAAFDPKFPGERVIFQDLRSGGVPPDIEPERSQSFTMGAVYQPSEFWKLSVTHWNIRFVNQLAYIGAQAIIDNEDVYPGRVVRSPETGRIDLVDSRQVNISLRETSGLDLDLSTSWSTPFGDFYPSLAATYTYRFDQKLAEMAPTVSNLAVYNSLGWAPRWKIVSRLAWDYQGMVNAMLVGRYVNRYRDAAPLAVGTNAGQYMDLGEFWVFDLNMNVNLGIIARRSPKLSRIDLSFGATNILNELPEFCMGCGSAGYDASQYDIMGRSLYAELKMSF